MGFKLPPAVLNVLPSVEVSATILLILLSFFGILGLRLAFRRFRYGRRPSATRRSRPRLWTYNDYAQPDPTNPVSQLEIVNRSDYEKVRILNWEESKLLPLLERTLKDISQRHRVMAQTSLGEVIKPKSSSPDSRIAMAVINSKRLDFAVIDRFGMLVCAVEYQGTGHHQNGAFLRDAVKREALRKAGVPTIEVSPDFRADALAQTIRDVLRPAALSA